MDKLDYLFKTADKFMVKYAGTQEEIQKDVANAAAWGKNVHGIMNFPEQLKKDQATLTIAVSKRGDTITVGSPMVYPSSVAGNYAELPGEIKAYLEKYIELFSKNESNVDIVLSYSGLEGDSGVS
jgi:hypothetical protein